MVLTLTANNEDRIVTWVMDQTFAVYEQYLLVSIANNNVMDMVKITLLSDATSADLSQFGKSSKVLVKLEQLDVTGNTLKSPTITLPALQIPLTPTLVSATGINKGIVVSFTVPQGSPSATQAVVIVTDLTDMASIEKTMPSVMVNGSYQVSVTSAEMPIIQENTSTSYEISVMLRNSAGDSDVSNVLSASLSNYPDEPNLLSVVSGGSGSAIATWTAPADNMFWNTSAITLYVYPTSNPFSVTPHPVTPYSATSKTITGLTNGTSYSFYVKYSNFYGEGEKSNTIAFTPYGTPSKVGDFNVYGYIDPITLASYQAQPRNLTLTGAIITSRTPPNATSYTMAENGLTITGYNIYREFGALLRFVPFQSLDSGAMSFPIPYIYFGDETTPLGTTSKFMCKTVGVSADNVTVESEPFLSSFTFHSNPLAVTNLVASGLDKSISLSWSASTTKGHPIQRYSIRNSSNEELFSTTSTNYSIANLANGMAQTYTVVAITQSDRFTANNTYDTIESNNNPSATATPHRAPVINSVTISGLTMILSITDNGLPATNVTAFAVDNTGISAIIQQQLINNQVTFNAPLTSINSYMVFVTNSANQMSNILYQVA